MIGTITFKCFDLLKKCAASLLLTILVIMFNAAIADDNSSDECLNISYQLYYRHMTMDVNITNNNTTKIIALICSQRQSLSSQIRGEYKFRAALAYKQLGNEESFLTMLHGAMKDNNSNAYLEYGKYLTEQKCKSDDFVFDDLIIASQHIRKGGELGDGRWDTVQIAAFLDCMALLAKNKQLHKQSLELLQVRVEEEVFLLDKTVDDYDCAAANFAKAVIQKYQRKDTVEAINILKASPCQNSRTYFFLGSILLGVKQYDEAEAYLKKSLSLGYTNALQLLCLLQVKKQDYDLSESKIAYSQCILSSKDD